MAKRHFSKTYLLALATLTGIGGGTLHAAVSATWTGNADATWANSGNWTPSIPGATTGITSGDSATFNTNPANGTSTPLVIDAGRIIGNISFNTAAGNFVIGNTGLNTLGLSSGGTTQILSTLTAASVTETINAPLTLEPASATTAGTYTFANNGTDNSTTLNLGGTIAGGTTTSTITLTLTGTNAGSNTISGNISNGGATGGLALTKSGAGTWILTGTNTASGAVTVTSGTLNVVGVAGANSLGTGAISISAGVLNASANSNGTFALGTGSLSLNSNMSLTGSAGNAVNFTGVNAVAATTLTFGAGGSDGNTIAFNANGGSVSYTIGNASNANGGTLSRSGLGTLVLSTTGLANLGTTEKFIVNGQAATTGTIYGPYVVTQDNAANNFAGDFVNYATGTGFQAASVAGVEVNQSATSLDSENSNSVVFNVDQAGATLTAARQVYALRTGFSIDLAGNNLIIGANTATPSGLILNGNGTAIGTTPNVGALFFGNSAGAGEAVIYTAQAATINAAMTDKAGLSLLGPGNLTLNGDITLGGANVISVAGDTVINGKISGTGSIQYKGTGNLTLNSDNSGFTGTFFTGPAARNFFSPVGTLTIGNDHALGSGIVDIYNDATGTFTTIVASQEVTLSNTINFGINSGGTVSNFEEIAGTHKITFSGNTFSNKANTFSNDIDASTSLVFSGNLALNEALTFIGTGNTVISGKVTGTGSIGYQGAGSLTLSNSSNDFAGGISINGGGNGTVIVGDNAALGTGTISLVSGTTTASPFISLQASAPVVIHNALMIGNQGIHKQLGVFAGSNSMTFTGPVTTTSFGDTIVNNMDSGAVLTFSGNTLTAGGSGTLAIGGSGTTVISDGISVSAAITYNGTGTLTLSGANVYTGATAVNSGTVNVLSLNSVAGGSASSSLGAPTSVANGTIAIGSGTSAAALVYAGTGETTDRVISLAGSTGGATIDQSGTGLLKFTSALTAATGGAKTLTLQGSTAGTGEIAAAIPNNSTANKTSLTKAGSGTWTLSGTNTYTGATTISGGTLSLAGSGAINAGSAITLDGNGAKLLNNSSIAITSAVTINNGTIGGTGVISAAGGITIGASATVSPGNSPAAQSYTTGMTFDAGGTYKWEINDATGTAGANFDQLVIAGGAGLNILAANTSDATRFTIDITSLTAANAPGDADNFNNTANQAWLIATAPIISGFDPSDFNLDTANFVNDLGTGTFGIHLGSDSVDGLTLDGKANHMFLTFTPGTSVPEPATLSLLALGALPLLLRKKRRQS